MVLQHNWHELRLLYNFADLLIVDEAERYSLRIAAASFALAKKALVIGDTEQIAPIWKFYPALICNMVEENILPGGMQEEFTDAYALVSESGKSAAFGQRHEDCSI